MEIKDKALLLTDLCARLPYGVEFESYGISGNAHRLYDIGYGGDIMNEPIVNHAYGLAEIKPYLRKLSSITDDELKELNGKYHYIGYFFKQNPPFDYGPMVQHADLGSILMSDFSEIYDWLVARHFDCHRLIEKGLALEAPEGMYDL